jgi:DNA-binding NtrC family response regulator
MYVVLRAPWSCWGKAPRLSTATGRVEPMAKIILVIDDDAVVRTTIEQILEDAGYEVVTARNGLHGTVAFHRTQPDLVITDIIMPEQDGIQTITEIRAAKPDAKIIAISGGGRIGNADFLAMARTLGAIDVIPKPFDSDELLTVVANCLAGLVGGCKPGQAA